MTHLAVHVPGALQPDRITDLLDRERRGNRHDELPGNNRRHDAFQRPGVASQSPVTPSPTSSTTPAKSPPDPADTVTPNRRAISADAASFQSTRFSAAAHTRTLTSPPPGCGSFTSRTASTSDPPNQSRITAPPMTTPHRRQPPRPPP